MHFIGSEACRGVDRVIVGILNVREVCIPVIYPVDPYLLYVMAIHTYIHTNSGYGNIVVHNNIRPWCDLQRLHPLLELPCGLLALCRRTLGSE